ncbi:kinesin motor protein cin8 [Physocladia obscura]|uniref:Kinesin motor protein cin8 n=1 Tax=Physocladia obscura TaxID=109957 RepID=A0AAD5XGC3_9FUNG|nr:kinesin motor protein cin8 [Physocladia obscura]
MDSTASKETNINVIVRVRYTCITSVFGTLNRNRACSSRLSNQGIKRKSGKTGLRFARTGVKPNQTFTWRVSNFCVNASPAIVTTSGVKGKELHIRANPSDPTSTKTYSFDKVFGPDADQETIYAEVVAPILEEVEFVFDLDNALLFHNKKILTKTQNQVLLGYNCTIFAYGQTGTGKTHTMEGDLESCQGKQAGIIPRTLYRLFDKLEKDDSEYSVRVSCLEIYNEELRDLLASDENAQPKLKIFEDVNRRGSNEVQGMERILVTSAQDVIAVLQRGSQKRQTAATKMNESSSRSHCIFTITVHIKETTPDGEDLLKVGKLNLVDLAGSENVGRSGAEKGRAKEAGMINQSLLTLGRVINSLVEKGLHIPYRESKLTRLLQDSLGGKTKTCIIAAVVIAVSPAKANLEETLSTLDYAHRAKNIRNKPEANQRMTKKALIRDYETQIERLKLDLQATRDKNGVYMAADTYKDLMETQQGRKDRIEEMEKTVQAKEDAITKLETDFAEQIQLLEHTRKQLIGTQRELNLKTQTLEEALGNVSVLKKDLNEQKILTEAHSTTENSLHNLHSGLVNFMHVAVADNQSLHEKIERKSAAEIANMRLFNEFQNGIMSEIATLESGADMFKTVSDEFFGNVFQKLKTFHETHFQSTQAVQSETEKILSFVLEKFTEIGNSQKSSHTNNSKTISSLQSCIVELVVKLQEQQEENKHSWAKSHNSFDHRITQHNEIIKQWHAKLEHFLSMLISFAKENIQKKETAYMAFKDFSLQAMNDEIETLRSQNKLLQEKLSANELAQKESEKSLLSSITGLVQKFTQESNSRIANIHNFAAGNCQSILNMKQKLSEEVQDTVERDIMFFEQDQNLFTKKISETNDGFSIAFKDVSDDSENMRKIFAQASEQVISKFDLVSKAASEGLTEIETLRNDVSTSALATLEAQQSRLNTYTETAKFEFGGLGKEIGRSGDHVDKEIGAISNLVGSYASTNSSFVIDTAYTISEARNETQCKRFTFDEPTGKTPRKRKLQLRSPKTPFQIFISLIIYYCKKTKRVPLDWYKTRDHNEILTDLRTHGEVQVLSEPIAVSMPLFKKPIVENSIFSTIALIKPSVDDSEDLMDETHDGVEDEECENVIALPIVPAALVEKSVEKPATTRLMGKIRTVNGTAATVSKLPTRQKSRGSF